MSAICTREMTVQPAAGAESLRSQHSLEPLNEENSMIEETELRAIIEKLDVDIPKDEARVKLTQYGGGPDEGMVIGNPRGYLRLGVEFLKGAFANFEEDNKGDKTKQIDMDLHYLLSRDSDIRFDWFERREDLATDSVTSSWWQDKVVPWIILATIISILILAVIGFVALVIWLK